MNIFAASTHFRRLLLLLVPTDMNPKGAQGISRSHPTSRCVLGILQESGKHFGRLAKHSNGDKTLKIQVQWKRQATGSVVALHMQCTFRRFGDGHVLERRIPSLIVFCSVVSSPCPKSCTFAKNRLPHLPNVVC